MRLRLAAVTSSCVLLASQAFGEQTFPYAAYVNADNVYIRSGPGRNYYPTSKLHTGDRVEVYRHDPGGWYAIRPVEGSFTWVSGRYLEVGEDGLGKVTGDRVAARVGSEFSNIRDVIQVRLHQGEIVEVLGTAEVAGDAESGAWYKVAPPSGEFRWVFGKFVDPDYHQSGVRKTASDYSPLAEKRRPPTQHVVRTPSVTGEPQAEARPQGTSRSPKPSTADVQTAEYWLASGSSAEPQASTRRSRPAAAETRRDPREAPAPYTNKFVEPAHDPEGTPTMRRLSPEEFQAELDQIDMELSIMLAEEPTVWSLDELALRAEALRAEAETAVERGRVRLLANKIAQSADIKRRYDAVHGTRTATERQNRQLSGLVAARDRARPPLASHGRFDGDGRLVRVVPPKLGAPRFALLDEKGSLRCYVTPAPGVNLNHYLGRWIGVNGSRGYLAKSGSQHVIAKHVSPLDTRRLR
jgi:hypothetical protein